MTFSIFDFRFSISPHHSFLAVIILFFTKAGAGDTDFTDLLVEKGFYSAAVRECRRELTADGSDTLGLYIKIGDIFRQAGQPVQAQPWYEKVIDTGGDDRAVPTAFFRLAEMDLENRAPRLARYELKEMDKLTLSKAQQERKQFLTGLSYAYIFETDSVAALLGRIPEGSPYKERSGHLIARSRRYAGADLKHPLIAMALSAGMPGAGQFYTGNTGAGIKSLLLNTALGSVVLYSGYRAYRAREDGRKKDYRVAVMDATFIFSGIFMRYYNSSKNDAYKRAIKYNSRIQDAYLEDITEMAGVGMRENSPSTLR